MANEDNEVGPDGSPSQWTEAELQDAFDDQTDESDQLPNNTKVALALQSLFLKLQLSDEIANTDELIK